MVFVKHARVKNAPVFPEGLIPRPNMLELEEGLCCALLPGGPECWLAPSPYHGVYIPGHGTHASHRLAYRIYRGEVPLGWILHHVCLEPRCWNPFHLQVVTPLQHRHLHPR